MERAYIDIHVHAVPRAGYVEHDLWERTVFRFLRQLSLGGSGIADSQDDHPAVTYITVLRDRLGAARHVNRAVLLALDGVYDSQGRFDTRRTRFHVPNDDVVAWRQQYPDRFLFGASVHPHRPDALGFPSRMGTLLWWRDRPDFWDRLLFGTDYPVPLFNPPWRPFLSQPAYAALVAEHNNPFDCMALLLEGLGIHLNPDIAARLLGHVTAGCKLIQSAD